MSIYNYQILSFSEFENLVKDVVEQLYSIKLECFTAGRDGGIDLRYASDDGKAQIIVQAKCYKNYASLRTNLKKENSKVQRLAPQRYILITSVGLTPQNKDEIKEIFSPYILNTGDIIGGDELDFCIKGHQDILKKNYKLWLSSVEILDIILHSKVFNQSVLVLKDIQDNIKYYVFNDSFTRARQLLHQHKYVIISGIPGIGKTTLAQMLAYDLLANGYEEFIYINNSVDEAYEVLGEEERKQVFLFDDFLGGNYLENKGKCLDSGILKFISHVQRSKNKILILTTREYILRQAENESERWKYKNTEIAKCIIDLRDYTKKNRAQILCNHLAFTKIPVSYLERLHENYLPVIEHENYNPRLIEMFIDEKIWEKCTAREFPMYLKNFFDDPRRIWDYAYNAMEELSQVVLIVLFSLRVPVLYEDLLTAVKAYLATMGKENLMGSYSLKRAIEVLENTFIVTGFCSASRIVAYKNPGVYDFLYSRIKEEEGLIARLVESVVFINQITDLFCQNGGVRLPVSKEQSIILANWYVRNHRNLQSSVLTLRSGAGGLDFVKDDIDNIYSILLDLLQSFGRFDERVENAVVYYINTNLVEMSDSSEIRSFISILEILDLKKLKKPAEIILKELADNLYFFKDYWMFCSLLKLFPLEFRQLTASDKFLNLLDKAIWEDIKHQGTFDDLMNLELKIEELVIYYPTVEISRYHQILCEMENSLYYEMSSENLWNDTGTDDSTFDNGDEGVDEVFTALLETRR